MHRISLATQSLWDRSLEEAIEVAARVGYDGVEIVCYPPHLPLDHLQRLSDSIPKKLDALQLEVASRTVITDFVTPETIPDNVRFLDSIVDLAAPYNTRLVKMSPGAPTADRGTPEQWESAITHIAECADHARDKRVALAIETHLGQLSNTLDGTLRLVRGIDRPNVGVVLDWCNIMVEGGDPLEATEALGEHILLVHAKDGHMVKEGPRWDPIGEGELDYPALLGALGRTGYEGFISVESLLVDPRYDFTGRPTDPERIVAGELAGLSSMSTRMRD